MVLLYKQSIWGFCLMEESAKAYLMKSHDLQPVEGSESALGFVWEEHFRHREWHMQSLVVWMGREEEEFTKGQQKQGTEMGGGLWGMPGKKNSVEVGKWQWNFE